METDALTQLSTRLADLTEQGAGALLRLEGRRRGAISAVAWSEDGVAVAAHHALDRDEEVRVRLPGGQAAVAAVIGRDPSTDLAALRVRGARLAPPRWAEPGPRRAGELLLGLFASGRGPRAELGLLTRVAGEYLAAGGGAVDRWLETSLPLCPGLSGGLALDAGGAALGVLGAGLVRGAAMVAPPATLRRVMEGLLAHGRLRRGWLGVATLPVPLEPALRAATGEPLALLVVRVEPGSPAARAGLLFGDALLSFGNATLQDPGELLGLLAEERIGEAVPMRLLRAGEVRDVTVTIAAHDEQGRP